MRFECPHCQRLIELSVRGKKKKDQKETENSLSKDIQWALINHYLDIKKVTDKRLQPMQISRLTKAMKELYALCEGDVEKSKTKITQANDYFSRMGVSWTIETALRAEHFAVLGDNEDSGYKGWT